MDALGSDGFIKLASHVTVKQILERDDFSKRLREERPIALHELLYPLVQAYDSVALEADVELGGTDQKFNLLMGRNLQREYGQPAQVAVITPLLRGLDGVHKMSKSLDNYIGINEPPDAMFGKIMSVSDELMWEYYELCTDLRPAEISALRSRTESGALNPRDAKVQLAQHIISDFHTPQAAQAAVDEFNRRFRDKQAPRDIAEYPVTAGAWPLARLLVETGLAVSLSEARRLVQQGGVTADGERISNVKAVLDLTVGQTVTLKVGKLRFLRVLAQ